MGTYTAVQIDQTGYYRIIDPRNATMPLRPLGRKDADKLVTVLNLFLDPER